MPNSSNSQSNSSPQKKYVREVRVFDDLFQDATIAGPTGLVYDPKINRLLSLNAESGAATTSDLTAITPIEARDAARSARLQTGIANPLNTTFDSKFNRLVALQNLNQLITVGTKADGTIDPATLTRTNVAQQFGLKKPQGMSVDSGTGTLYILDQSSNGSEIVRVQPDANGSFAKATISRIALPGDVANPRGIAFDPTSGNLQVLSPSQKQLYEVSQAGSIVATRDLSGIALKNPQAIAFAPSGDQTDNPQELSLYVADSTAGGGGIRELTFVEPTAANSAPTSRTTAAPAAASLTPNNSATLVRIVNTSQYSPASPDPDGIVYISHTNSLMIADGEVEEMPNLFAGKNIYNTTLSGSLQSTQSTLAFTKEPTGVAYNPANKFIYFSDDDKLKVFQVNPGTDGLYFTSDDAVSSFSTSAFGGADTEDLAFSTQLGDLFLMDGLNSQVYRVTTSGTLVSQFDTESLGILDPEGITVGDNGNLFIVGNPSTNNNSVAEVTTSGQLVQLISIAAANPVKPAGLTFAPSSQDSTKRSLYIVDRGVDNNDNPNENDGRMYEFALAGTPTPTPGALSFGAATFSVNENGTPVAAVQVTRTGGTSGAVSATVSLANGTATAPADYNNSPIVVNFADGDSATKTVVVPIVDDTAVEGNETVNLSLASPTNGATIGSQSTATLTIVDNDSAPTSSRLFLSFNGNGTVGGVSFADEDILEYNESNGTWSTYFDGSDVGLSSVNVRDFHVNTDGSILLSLNNSITLPGAGTVDGSDVIRFVPTSTGTNTSGTFNLYFDGSDVGLDTSSEKLDAIAIAPDGRLVISTEATPSVPGLTGLADEDLLAFNATSLGDNTAGTWTVYFDGSDVALTDSSEDVDGVWIDSTGKLYLSTEGAFTVPNATGDGSDVFTFTPTSIGANTSGNFAPPFFDGSNNGLTTVVTDGVSRLM